MGRQLAEALHKNKNVRVSELLGSGRIGPHNINEADADGRTALDAACWKNNVAAVAKILSILGIDVNVRDKDGVTPIMRAAVKNSSEALKLLLDHPGVDVNARDNVGWTAIMLAAAQYNSSDALKLLLDHPGVDVNARNNKGDTPIMCAATHCSSETLKILLDHPGVDLDDTDNDGRGLKENVGRSNNYDSTEKSRCLEMIAEKRIELEELAKAGADLTEKSEPGNSLEEVRTNVRQQYIDKIDKINEEIETLDKTFRNNTELRDKLKKQNEENRQQVANLKYISKQLAEDLRKLDFDPVNDASANLEAARETLECPVCMEIMRPPMQIWMCSSSHLVCQPCKDRLQGRLCPTCRTERVTLRAHMAENFATTLFKN